MILSGWKRSLIWRASLRIAAGEIRHFGAFLFLTFMTLLYLECGVPHKKPATAGPILIDAAALFGKNRTCRSPPANLPEWPSETSSRDFAGPWRIRMCRGRPAAERLLAVACLIAAASVVSGDGPSDAPRKAALIGQPTKLEIQP